jgi:hypothetical protein
MLLQIQRVECKGNDYIIDGLKTTIFFVVRVRLKIAFVVLFINLSRVKSPSLLHIIFLVNKYFLDI